MPQETIGFKERAARDAAAIQMKTDGLTDITKWTTQTDGKILYCLSYNEPVQTAVKKGHRR